MRAGKPARFLPSLTGAPLPPICHRTMAEKADVRRVGIELGSEGVSTSSQCVAWDPSICPSNRYPPGQTFKARASLLAEAWMLMPAHLPAHMHSLAGFFGGLYRAFYFNVTYRKHERRQSNGSLWPRAA